MINKQDYRPGYDAGKAQIEKEELERLRDELENNDVSRPLIRGRSELKAQGLPSLMNGEA